MAQPPTDVYPRLQNDLASREHRRRLAEIEQIKRDNANELAAREFSRRAADRSKTEEAMPQPSQPPLDGSSELRSLNSDTQLRRIPRDVAKEKLSEAQGKQTEAARRGRQAELEKHLSGYPDDPVSQVMARAEFKLKEHDDQVAARKKVEDDLVSEYDDPLVQVMARGSHRLKQRDKQSPSARAFAESESVDRQMRVDKFAKYDDQSSLGIAALGETFGGFSDTGASIYGTGLRAFGQGDAADEIYRSRDELQQGRAQNRGDDLSPWLSRQYGGVVGSLSQTFATPGGLIAKGIGAGLMQGSESLTTAEDAGLQGSARARYAITQGSAEAVFELLGNKVFGAGIQGRIVGKSLSARTYKELVKNFGGDGAKELPGELLTLITQDVSSKLEGVSPDMTMEDFLNHAGDVIAQTVLQSAIVSAPDAARLATGRPQAEEKYRKGVEAAIAKDKAETEKNQATIDAYIQKPSEINYKAAVAAGMPPLDNPNRGNREQHGAELRAKQAAQNAPPAPPEVDQQDAQVPPAPEVTQGNVPDDESFNPFGEEGEEFEDEANTEATQKPEDTQGQAEGVLKQTGAASPEPEPAPEVGPAPVPSPPSGLRGSNDWATTPVERIQREITDRRLSLATSLPGRLTKQLEELQNITLKKGSAKRGIRIEALKSRIAQLATETPQERLERIDSAGSDSWMRLDADDKQLFLDSAEKFKLLPDNVRADAEAEWNTSGGVASGTSIADFINNVLRGTRHVMKGIAHPEITDPDVRAKAEKLERSLVLVSRTIASPLNPTFTENLSQRKKQLQGELRSMGVTPNEVGRHAPVVSSATPQVAGPVSTPETASIDPVASDETWWNNSLTSAGRAGVLRRVGLQLPHRVLWQHMNAKAQEKVRTMRPSATASIEQAEAPPVSSTAPQTVSQPQAPQIPVPVKTEAEREAEKAAPPAPSPVSDKPTAPTAPDSPIQVGDLVTRGDKTGVVTGIRGSGDLNVEFEETVVGRSPVSLRYSGFTIVKPSEVTKSGRATFPVTLEQFYQQFGNKNAAEITTEITQLWGSLNLADKSRFTHRLRKVGIAGAKSNSTPSTLAASIVNVVTQSKGIPGKLREVYDIAQEYPDTDSEQSQDNPDRDTQIKEMMQRIDDVGLELGPMVRAAMTVPSERRSVLHNIASRQFGKDIADAMFDDTEATPAQAPGSDKPTAPPTPSAIKVIEPADLKTQSKKRRHNPATGRSLRSLVLAQGGISAKSLRGSYNLKELNENGLFGVMRIGGQPLDRIAQVLVSSGDLIVPETHNADDWLIEQLQRNADGARAEYTDKEIGKRLEAEREAYVRVKEAERDEQYDRDRTASDEQYNVERAEAGTDELRQRSEAEGIRAANAEESDEGFSLNEENGIVDLSFDFGANAESATADEDAFTLQQPPKPRPKAEDFGNTENTKQGALFDVGKKGDLKGQELLFNSDAGDLQNPKTMENKVAAEKAEVVDPAAMTEEQARTATRAEFARLKAEREAAEKPPAKESWGSAIVLNVGAGRKPSPDKAPATPKAPRSALGQKTEKLSEKTGERLNKADAEFLKEMNDLELLSLPGFNMKGVVAAVKLTEAYVTNGAVKFADFVVKIGERLGEATARKLAPYLEMAWEIAGETDSRLDVAGKVADVLGPEKEATPATGWASLPGHFAKQLMSGTKYKTIVEARKEAAEIVGHPIHTGTADAKRLDELIEYGVVQAGRQIVAAGGTPSAIFDKLVDLYERQPVLGVRTSTSMLQQAYSTPVPLAYLVSELAHVTAQTTVYEPTAGNGMLLIGTAVENASVNELNPERAETLRDQGFQVTQEDAVTQKSPMVDVVLANPPFGKVKDANQENTEFDIDGFKTKEVDHAIILQSLKGMKPDGYAVLILAAKGHNVKTELERRQEYRGKDKPFYDALYEGYDVTNHFTVSGSLYSRQGASFPVDVIVIRPQGTVPVDQKRATPWAVVPRKFDTWQELKNVNMAHTGEASGVSANDGRDGSADPSTRNQTDMGRLPGQDGITASVDEGDVGSGKPESVVSPPVVGKTGGRRGGKTTGGPRSQSSLSGNVGGTESDGIDVPTASTADSASTELDSRTGSDRVAGTLPADSGKVDQDSHQVSYESLSKNKSVDTVIPSNLQSATRMALQNVEDTYGQIDEFVQKELGYKKNDPFFKDMSAEQVDAIGLAIHAHKVGAGMIVGDMTGVGKGRVAAAIMRYAELQGLVPVFITEKPDLFGDIYRDLADVGSDSTANPFIGVPTMDLKGTAAIDLPNGRKLDTSIETNIAHFNEGLASLKAGNGFMVNIDGVQTKVNAVFSMYTQLQTVGGAETSRRSQLRELMPYAFVILDESHNAGGSAKTRVNRNAPPDRAAFARELIEASAGTLYMSATFAKRPDVMSLYMKTDMSKAVNGDISALADVIKSGGLPLQQVVSAMLAEVGQYIRREKSFAGVQFAEIDIPVDLEEQDRITDVLRIIKNLDSVMAAVVAAEQSERLKRGEMVTAGSTATGDRGMVSTSFGSLLWSAVDQMLFALKADKAADAAIASWNGGKDTVDKNGVVTKSETPIIAVDNTMGTLLDEFVKDNNLKVGDPVNLNFKDILIRYLERSRVVTVDTGRRDAKGKVIKRKDRLTDAQLNHDTPGGNGLAMYREALRQIQATAIDAPASPIDWMRYRMQQAGMKLAEVTGRKSMIIYTGHNKATLAARPKSEMGTRGKQNTIKGVNDGSLDGLILNRSGATGLSIHASEKFRNKKVRHMFIVQAAKNIDEFMQMLGRTNRTGQVVQPRYSLVKSNSPSEMRPAAVLSKKLSSLNASVTAKSKGAVGFDVVDVMNQVGGIVMAQYLIENPVFNQEVGDPDLPTDGDPDSLEELVRLVTGRSAVLPHIKQQAFWDDIEAAYNALIQQLNARNANPLIAQTIDLDAKSLSSVTIFEGEKDQGPFAAQAELQQMDVKSQGKPLSPDAVKGQVQEFYGIKDIEDRQEAAIKWQNQTIAKLKEELIPFRKEATTKLVNPVAVLNRETAIREQAQSVGRAIREFPPGTVINFGNLTEADNAPPVWHREYFGVVIGFKRTGKEGNPVAPSRWMVEIAINSSAQTLTIPVSQIAKLQPRNESLDVVLEEFQTMQTVSREHRWVGTGNLMAAFAQLNAEHGKLVFYSDNQGEKQRGILMPRTFESKAWLMNRPIAFKNSTDILEFFNRGGTKLMSIDGELRIEAEKRNYQVVGLLFVAPAARRRGGIYTLNPAVITAAHSQWHSASTVMSLRVPAQYPDRQKGVLDAILNVTTLQVPEGYEHLRTNTPTEITLDRNTARAILGLNKNLEKIEPESDVVAEPEAPAESALRKSAREAQEAVEAQKVENAKQNEIIKKELQKPSTAGAVVPITKELSAALWKRMTGQIKEGFLTFDAFVKALRADFDDVQVLRLKKALIKVWNAEQAKHGLDEATPAGFDTAMAAKLNVNVNQDDEEEEDVSEVGTDEPIKPTRKRAPTRNEVTDDDDEDTIGIKKAARADRRDELGLDPEGHVDKIGHSFPELDAEAKRVSPGEADEVFARIGQGKEAADNASDRDVFVMLNHYAKQQLQTTKILSDLKAANEAGNDSKIVELEAALSVSIAEEVRYMAIAKNAGTAAGRALAAFKALLKYDMSLARLRMRLDAANGGKATDAQVREQNALHAKYEAALKDVEAKTKEAETATIRAEIAEQAAKHWQETAEEAKAAAHAVQTPPAPQPSPAPAPATPKAPTRLEAALNARRKANIAFSGLAVTPEDIEVAAAYIEEKVTTFKDFIKKLTKFYGRKPKDENLPILQQAWDTAWANANPQANATPPVSTPSAPPEISIEPDSPRSLVGAAKALFRYFASQGITDTDALIDAVHEELQDQFPDETRKRSDTMGAMVDYDKIRTISKDPLDILMADKRAVVQMKKHLANMSEGLSPNRLEQRHPVSTEQREHRKMVKEEQRKGGFTVTDPERQATSTLAAMETRLRNAISDTINEIANNKRAVPNKTVAPISSTTLDLQSYLDLVRGMHKAIFGDKKMTQEQRLKAAEAAAVKNEAFWNDRLARAKKGDFSTGKKKSVAVTNANIDAIKARTELAKAQTQELKALAKPKPDPEAIADARYITSLANQLAVKLERIVDITAREAKGDFKPERNVSKEKREANAKRRKSDAATRDSRIALDETATNLHDLIERVAKSNLTYVDLAKKAPRAAWASVRDMTLSGELSFILRQGGPRVMGALFPVSKIARAGLEVMRGDTDAAKLKIKQARQGYGKLAKTLARTFKAALWATDTEIARSADRIRQKPNYLNGTYEVMKIGLHIDGGKFSTKQELFINNLVEIIGLALDKRFPGFKGFRDGHPVFTKVAHNLNLFNRISNATKVFMDEIRTDMADEAVESLTLKKGEMTAAEARNLGGAINAFTGKGDMSLAGADSEKMTDILGVAFISAPWLMSRAQIVVLHPMYSKGSTKETRLAAAELYVDIIAGVSLYYSGFILAGMFMDDDDDERPIVELDSTSADFLKVRIGKTMRDPLLGLQQVIVLISRFFHDDMKNSYGVVVPREGLTDDFELVGRFIKGRLHPSVHAGYAFKSGKDFFGQPISKRQAVINLVMPITYPSIVDATKDLGIPATIGTTIEALLGMPLMTYSPRIKKRADVVEEIRFVHRKISKTDPTNTKRRESLQAEAGTLMERHLVNAVKDQAGDDKNAALKEQALGYEPGTPKSPELTAAIQKEKYDIILEASDRITTDRKRNAEKKEFSGNYDKGRIAARSLVPLMIPKMDDAITLYNAAYKDKNGRLREKDGDHDIKESVEAGRARIKQIYQQAK